MFQVFHPPHPALLEYVESILTIDIDFRVLTEVSPFYTYVPTHTRFLCFYLQDPVKVKKQDGDFEVRARSVIIGPHLSPVILDLGQVHRTVIVSLKTGGMYRLLGIPLEEIVDRDFDARLVIGREIDELLDRLHAAPDSRELNNIIQDYLLSKLQRLKPMLPFDHAMTQLVNATGNLSMDYLASQSCLSIRQFERKSLERIGLTPKFFARMVRFSQAYRYKEATPDMPWIEIAYRCGYFDQMHLIRDFKSFAGITPTMLKEADIRKSVRFQRLAEGKPFGMKVGG